MVTRHHDGSLHRIAWLLPSMARGSYWHPVLQEFAKLFPETILFTGNWPGFASGSEASFRVQVVGKTKYLKAGRCGRTFILPSLRIVPSIVRFRPHVIFTAAFSLWTTLALWLRPWTRWRIVVVYDGSAPSIDSTNSRLRGFLRRLIANRADGFVTNSRAGRDYLTKVLHADPDKVFKHPYEVPSARALMVKRADPVSRSWFAGLEHPVFVFIGQLITRKGLHFLLEACALLKRAGYTEYSLLVVGDGPQRDEAEKAARQRGLTSNVKFVGWVPYGDLGIYLGYADVFVFPTLEDVWGMAILEAMVFGKPILCSKWAGAAEMVVEGKNGFVFDPYRPEQLARLMSRFMTDSDLIPRMGNVSRQIIAPHTPRAAAKNLAEVAKRVLHERTNSDSALGS